MAQLNEMELWVLAWFERNMPIGNDENYRDWGTIWTTLAKEAGVRDEWTCKQIIQHLTDLKLLQLREGEGSMRNMRIGRITGLGIQQLREAQAAPPSAPGSTDRAGLVFVSSHHADYPLAALIARALEKFGFECFVAHREIAVAKEWRDEIIGALSACDCALALISADFRVSEWCGQECGFVLGRGRPVFPVLLDGHAPKGLLEAYQGLSWTEDAPERSMKALVRAIADGLRMPTEYLVRAFTSSTSFEEASLALSLVLERDDLTRDQANAIGGAYVDKPELRTGPAELPGFGDFYKRYNADLESDLREHIGRLPTRGPRSVPI